jgi:hypothetical protein
MIIESVVVHFSGGLYVLRFQVQFYPDCASVTLNSCAGSTTPQAAQDGIIQEIIYEQYSHSLPGLPE